MNYSKANEPWNVFLRWITFQIWTKKKQIQAFEDVIEDVVEDEIFQNSFFLFLAFLIVRSILVKERNYLSARNNLYSYRKCLTSKAEMGVNLCHLGKYGFLLLVVVFHWTYFNIFGKPEFRSIKLFEIETWTQILLIYLWTCSLWEYKTIIWS